MNSANQLRDLVGGDDGKEIDELAKLPSSHFIPLQIFLDLEEKRREWEASSNLGYKLIYLHEEEDDSDKKDEDGPRSIHVIYQLLNFL